MEETLEPTLTRSSLGTGLKDEYGLEIETTGSKTNSMVGSHSARNAGARIHEEYKHVEELTLNGKLVDTKYFSADAISKRIQAALVVRHHAHDAMGLTGPMTVTAVYTTEYKIRPLPDLTDWSDPKWQRAAQLKKVAEQDRKRAEEVNKAEGLDHKVHPTEGLDADSLARLTGGFVDSFRVHESSVFHFSPLNCEIERVELVADKFTFDDTNIKVLTRYDAMANAEARINEIKYVRNARFQDLAEASGSARANRPAGITQAREEL